MTNPPQHADIHGGVADDDSKKRKLLLELKESVEGSDKMKPDEKKKLLEKMGLANLIELEKTRGELLKDGKALLEDQKKQERGKQV